MLRRLAAGAIDIALLVTTALAPVLVAASYLPHLMDSPAGQPPTPLMGATLLWMIVTLLWYFPGFESSALMATPGKLAMGLKVVQAVGRRLEFTQALYRMVFGPLALWFLPLYRDRMSGGARVIDRRKRAG